jgi:hypothetical protein
MTFPFSLGLAHLWKRGIKYSKDGKIYIPREKCISEKRGI